MPNITPSAKQVEVIENNWSAYQRGRVFDALFDKPGFGKTLPYVEQCKRIRASRISQGKRAPVVWHFTENRAKETQKAKWFMFDPSLDQSSHLTVITLDGNTSERQTLLQMAAMLRSPVLIANYRQLCLHIDDYMQWVSDDDILLADEVDLASPSGDNASQVNYAVRAMANKCFHRILATGTFIRNRVDTGINLFPMGDPVWIHQEEVEFGDRSITLPLSDRSAYWGERPRILDRYGVYENGRLTSDIQRKEEFNARLVEWGASLNETDVDKDDPIVITTPLSPGQRVNYDHAINGLLELYEEVAWASRQTYGQDARAIRCVLAQIQFLRYCCGLSGKKFRLVVSEHKAKQIGKSNKALAQSLFAHLQLEKLSDDGDNSRVNAVLDLLAQIDWDIEGGVYMFSPFKEVAKEVAHAVIQHGYDRYGVALMTGETSPREQYQVIRKIESGEIRIAITSTVGGRSNDMQKLNIPVNLIPPYTPAEIEQAMARVARFGQTRTVKPFYMGATATIEENYMLPMLAAKGSNADDVFYGKRGRRSHFESISNVATLKKYL